MTERDEENNSTETKEPEVVNESTEIICSKCGERNIKGHYFCIKCGNSLVDKLICPKCNSEMPIYSTFCGKCGAPLKFVGKPTQSNVQMMSPQMSMYTQPPYALTPEQQQKMLEQQRIAKMESRKNTAKVLGIISLVFAALGLIYLIIEMVVISSDVFEELLIDYGLEGLFTLPQYYAVMIGFILPPVIILGISGLSLIKPKEQYRPWKSLYLTLRLVFISFSAVIVIISFISALGWVFYNPSEINTFYQAFWFFKIYLIPSGMTVVNLFAIIFSIYTLCILLLIVPSIIRLIKKNRKALEKKSIEKSKLDLFDETENIPEVQSQKQPQIIYFTSRNEQFRAMKERKGPMPAIFYQIKNTPIIKSMELLCASYVVSIVISLILSGFANEDVPTEVTYTPFEYMIQVTWAGIFEELSFRLILIGGPMIFVIFVRLIIQIYSNKHAKLDNSKKLLETESKIDEIMAPKKQKAFLLQNEAKLSYKDILFALRGKYKIIGIPEWILVGCSSIIFGFAHWHGWTGGWGAWKIVQAGAMGFFLSYAFVKYGIESSMFIHITNNLIASLVVMTAEVPSASWLGFFTTMLIPIFLIVGVMKATSWIINLVYRFKIIRHPYVDM